jgi:uncharacterized membrane protein (DUF4010 family)
MDDYQIGLEQFTLFAQSVGIGFLIGLERERHEGTIAGVRTFTLIALAGSLSGFITSIGGWALAPWVMITLVVVSLLVEQWKSPDTEPDTTSVLAAILTFVLGYILWLGPSFVPSALAIVVAAVLYFREELRNLPRRLSRQDIMSFFQFAAVAFILLPILPDQAYGPYLVINPYQIGWLVVLISGISLAGYVALRLLRGKSGLIIVGLLGGLTSTTATTLVYSRHSKSTPEFARNAAVIILLSHLVLFARIAVVVTIVERSLLTFILPWIVGGLVAGVVCLGVLVRGRSSEHYSLPELTVSNPAELKTALGFAVGFALVLLLSAWMHDIFQNAGGYVIAFLSGLTDVDAITVANLKLFSVGSIDANTAARSIVVAFIANLLFKSGIVLTTADRALWRPLFIGFGVLLLGVLAGLSFGAL